MKRRNHWHKSLMHLCMYEFKKICFVATCFLVINPPCKAQLPSSDPDYKLVFGDEFDRTYPPDPVDTKKWARTGDSNQQGNLTQSVSWCFPEEKSEIRWDRAYTIKDAKDTTTVAVSNGTCKIRTNKTPYQGQISNWPQCDPKNPGYAINGEKCKSECKIHGTDKVEKCWTTKMLPFKYTTGMLFSRQKFRYGYFEIRFKLPPVPQAPYTHEGFGPNFWLYGNKRPENYTSEIDIFEIIALNPGRNDSNRYTSTVHYSDKDVPLHPTAHTEEIGNRLKNDTAWHTAAAWWTEDFIKFYFDGALYYTVQERKDIPVDKLVEMNLIIDVNSPTSGRCNNFNEKYTQFPYVYEIDYVRVYQKK